MRYFSGKSAVVIVENSARVLWASVTAVNSAPPLPEEAELL